MSSYIEKLLQIKKDPHQYEAFTSKTNTVVIAGPGSGKTTVLTLKIMSLLQEAIVEPRGLACITYSRAAAREFEERLLSYGYQPKSNVFLGTVHAFCIAEVIAPFAHLSNYEIPLPLKIISEKERKLLFNEVCKVLHISNDDLKIEEMDKERNLIIEGISKVQIPSYDLALRVALEFEDRLHVSGRIDYIDVVKYATLIIQKEKYVRDCLEAKFPWILIDEYQDLGKPLHEMVLSLFNLTKIKFFAVGDPNQSIYSFAGAIPDYLLELSALREMSSIELLTNFRSNQGIIDAYTLAMPPASIKNYKAGSRFNEEAEFKFVTCNEGLEDQYRKVVASIIPECIQNDVPYREICVLVGSNDNANKLGELFQSADIPYHINKRKDFEITEIVKWLIGCANWCLDSTKESFSDLYLFWANIFGVHKGHSITNDVVKQKLFYAALTQSKQATDNLSDWLDCIDEQVQLLDLLFESDIYSDEHENLKKLKELAYDGEFQDFSLKNFVEILKSSDRVTISTRHSSKGLEFEVVILLGLEDGSFPFFKSINSKDPSKLEEEFRIFFVCISRAKRACYLVRSLKQRNKYGRVFDREPSRFWTMLYDVYGD